MTQDDERAVSNCVQRWQEAWNRGDMAAAAALFCPDADFVNVRGSHWHGRTEIAARHAEFHQRQLKGSVMAPLHVGVQSLGSDVALVHMHWSLHGDHDLDGTPRAPRQGRFSWLMVRDATEGWRIRAAHNTNITPAT